MADYHSSAIVVHPIAVQRRSLNQSHGHSVDARECHLSARDVRLQKLRERDLVTVEEVIQRRLECSCAKTYAHLRDPVGDDYLASAPRGPGVERTSGPRCGTPRLARAGRREKNREYGSSDI